MWYDDIGVFWQFSNSIRKAQANLLPGLFVLVIGILGLKL